MKRCVFVASLLATLAAAPAAQALDILICNDDGFTSANSRALYERLVEDGHSVVMAAPLDNQSGRGGYVSFLAPIPPVPATYVDSYSGRTVTPRGVRTYPALVGRPGIGQDPADANIVYVNGSPVMACLYGIDVKAPRVFGHAPELVISGPNEGNNLGHINVSSGTVNSAYYAINRGLPAIGVSDAVSTSVEFTALTPASRAREVAAIVSRLVTALAGERDDDRDDDRAASADGNRRAEGREGRDNRRLLPAGVGLNVNVPSFVAGAGQTLRFALTHMGTATPLVPAFYEDLGRNPLAASLGIPAGLGLAGIGLAAGGATLPSGVTLPADLSPTSEANVIAAGGAVTVSPIAGVPEAETRIAARLRRLLR